MNTGSEHPDEEIIPTPLDSSFAEIAEPLGHVIIEFNFVEADAGRVIARLLKQNDLTAAAFAGALSFSAKLSLISTLVALNVHDNTLKQQFQDMIKHAKDLNEARNRFVHAEYIPILDQNDDVMEVMHRKLRDGAKLLSEKETLRSLLQPVDAARLTTLANDAHRLAYQMRVLAEKFVDQDPP